MLSRVTLEVIFDPLSKKLKVNVMLSPLETLTGDPVIGSVISKVLSTSKTQAKVQSPVPASIPPQASSPVHEASNELF